MSLSIKHLLKRIMELVTVKARGWPALIRLIKNSHWQPCKVDTRGGHSIH